MVRVLVVEDEEIIRKGLINSIDWLSKNCTIVGEAINGKDGLEKMQNLTPDLVITDIKMPEMDGLEMLRLGQERGLLFEAIVLTSYGEFDYAKESINLGVTEYILKPLDEEILYNALEKVNKKIKDSETLKNIENVTRDKEELNFFNINIYFENGSIKNRYVYKTLEKIKKSYQEKLNIKEIANELGVSTGYLSRKFKEELGETFLDILNKYRVQKSIKLLMKEEYKIYEVSEKVGFSDYKHFCNVFKKYINMAPGEFVKREVLIFNE